MRLQAVPILMATLAFCSADSSWGRGNAAPGPNTVSGINAAKALLDQYNAMHGGTPTSSQVTTPASSQVTSPASSQVTSPASTRAPATCYTKQQDVGACVKTSMCDLAPPKINPATLFGYRTRKTSANGCAFLEICCPNGKIRPTPVPPPTGTSGGTPPGCGYSNPAAARFRQGPGASNSGYADFAEFPWMVALLDKTKANQNSANAAANSGYMAGGTLIHPSVVMTVAHKVDTLNPSDLVCRAGEWDSESDNEVYTHQERDVIDIIPHEQFNKLHAHNDIALLKLATPFVFQPNINVACLSPAMPPSETMCYSMGWGMDFTKGKYYANVLKKVPLGLISSVECEERLRQTRLSRSYYLHHSLTCASGLLNVDTCIGDGGSSLVCPIGDPADRRYTVVGMVAYGLDCGQAGVPSVYTKVPEFYNWISNQLAIEGLSGRPYVS